MKKTVILRGPVLTQSGYGVHARQIAKWLLSKENIDVSFQALPWGETPWYLNPDSMNGLIGQIMSKTIDVTKKHDISIQLQLPNEWDPSIANLNIGITAGVETDRCNPAWITKINSMSRLIVPSKHVKQCFEKTGNINIPHHIVPESYFDSLTHRKTFSGEDIFNLSTDFNFLIFGQLTGNNPYNDRKNTFFTIKWLCDVFKDDPNVGIVLKTNAGRNTKIDRKNVVNLLKKLTNECRKGLYPKIHLIHGEMSDDDVNHLYCNPKIKALVSATRGEGYGLPILEAATAGLPVIATGWSGHMDFLSKGKFINLDYSLEEVHKSRIDENIFMKGSNWAFPKEDDFKKKILKFRNASSIPEAWANDLSITLSEEYSFNSIAKQYDQILGDLFS